MRKRRTRSACRRSAGKNAKRPAGRSVSEPDRTSLIARPPFWLSVFYRQRIERAPKVPGRDRAPGPPGLAELDHGFRRDPAIPEIRFADAFLQPEVVERKHVGSQQ